MNLRSNSVSSPLGLKTAGQERAAATSAWPRSARLGLALALCSGFAGLGYEIVWTQQLGIALGHEFVAVLAVLIAFFGGLALGAQCFARAIARSSQPARIYAACEGAIALWAWLLSACMPRAAAALASLIGAQPSALWHWTLALLGPLCLLFPATCAMGASLPALERAITRDKRGASVIAALYAANTFGAMLGVLACTLWLAPELGLRASARFCAALNLGCALGGLALRPGCDRALQTPSSVSVSVSTREEASARLRPARLSALLFATGVLGIGYEVLVVRVLAQITEDTLYTFAILLATYLFGTALGAACYQRWLAPRSDRAELRDGLLAGVALACLAGTCTLGVGASFQGIVSALCARLGAVGAALAGETAVAVAAFLPPAIAMGMLFSQLCLEAKRSGLGLSSAFACNTLGAALAPALFGVLLLPAFGARAALFTVALGYALLVRPASFRRATRSPRALVVFAAAGLVGLSTPSLELAAVPAGGRLLEYRSGIAASVSVIEDADRVSTLHINNRQQEGSSATLLADARQAWLPLLLHPHPRNALFLGLGTGLTAGAAGWDPGLRVDAVELLPEVVAVAPRFANVLGAHQAPRVMVADARRYVRAAGPSYDVVVADLFHPARSGTGALYTREHFAAVRARLAGGGLFCQWLPLHQLDLSTLRSIVASFIRVYPGASALLATNSLDTPVLGLVGRRGEPALAGAELRSRLATARARVPLSELKLEDELAVLGSLIAGPHALGRFAGAAELNTDDRAVVAKRAPLLTYAQSTSPRSRLVALLRELGVDPADTLAGALHDDGALRERLAAYFSARERYIALGTSVQPNGDARTLLTQLRAPLLAILRASPDFRPAYDPLLTMAQSLLPAAPAEARALLAELATVQPARPEAGRLLQRIGARGTRPDRDED